jgi:FKBP-type peptidyl-prolyl cis-trans isomerase
MAKTVQRVLALSLALIFFLTAFALSFFVIWQMYSNSKNSSSNQTASKQTCITTSLPEQSTLPAPEAYTSSPGTQLQITDISPGTGAAAKAGSCLVVKYYGTLAASSTMFDENFDKQTALEFQLGKGQVIKGWDQGLVGLQIGGTRRLVIPSALGYGAAGACKTYDTTNPQKCTAYGIPPNADLVFVVKLLRIQS